MLNSSPKQCLPCANGFVTNYFFTSNPPTSYSYYNPYTCYQVQPGVDDWTAARTTCANKGTKTTTMIIRTTNEYADAQRFQTLFGGDFWVCCFI